MFCVDVFTHPYMNLNADLANSRWHEMPMMDWNYNECFTHNEARPCLILVRLFLLLSVLQIVALSYALSYS